METGEIELMLEIEQHLATCLKKVRKYKLDNHVHRIRRTQLDIVEEILTQAAKPLHVREIICLAAANYRVSLKRATIVSAISKHVKNGDVFIKTGKNEFGLLVFNRAR
ncbi:MAG: hypothetical protein IJS15_10260 [Victivallales bacterium]|nr:hypothetical protein [Victivallales bacterium]